MAEQIQFTVKRIEALEPRERRYEVRDETQPKLRVVVHPTGLKVYYMTTRAPGGRSGRFERVKIGDVTEVKLETARKTVSKWLDAMRADESKNPAEMRRKARAEMTLDELWADWFAVAKKRLRSWRNDELQFEKHFGTWKTRKLNQISRTDVARLVGRVETAHGGYARNRALALLSRVWGWAQRERGLELPNPCKGVARAAEKPRERYLMPDELKRFYAALNARPPSPVRDVVELLLLTGQRKSTIYGLRWSEVDFRDAVLTIPAERMKSDRDHVVPLARPALEILKARRAAAESKAEYVFTSPTVRGHVYDLRSTLEAVLEAAGIEGRFTPHDLRRTWSTYAREKGRDPAPVLGHAAAGVTEKHYAMVTLSAMRETVRVTVDHMLTIAAAERGAVVAFPSA